MWEERMDDRLLLVGAEWAEKWWGGEEMKMKGENFYQSTVKGGNLEEEASV